jgi:hypothetical protein
MPPFLSQPNSFTLTDASISVDLTALRNYIQYAVSPVKTVHTVRPKYPRLLRYHRLIPRHFEESVKIIKSTLSRKNFTTCQQDVFAKGL